MQTETWWRVKSRVVTYQYSLCARCWLCWYTLNSSLTVSYVYNVFRFQYACWQHCTVKNAQVSVGNTNFTIIILFCFLPWTPNCKPHQNRKSDRMPITVGMNVHLQCIASNSATCILKGCKFRCFESWISVRLQAPYPSCPLNPCQYKTWPYTLPPCERSQSRAAKHPASGQTFKIMFVFAQNVEGSQLNCGRSEALRELFIEKRRHLFIEIAYINYRIQLVAILYQSRNCSTPPVMIWTLRHAFSERRSHRGRDCRDGKWHVWEKYKIHTKFLLRKRKGRDQAKDPGADGATV
jgi:hypothetical protein